MDYDLYTQYASNVTGPNRDYRRALPGEIVDECGVCRSPIVRTKEHLVVPTCSCPYRTGMEVRGPAGVCPRCDKQIYATRLRDGRNNVDGILMSCRCSYDIVKDLLELMEEWRLQHGMETAAVELESIVKGADRR